MPSHGVTSAGSTVRISDLVVRLRRRRMTVVVVTLVVLAFFALAGLRWPRGYESTAVVTVNPITTSPFGTTPAAQQINTTTERSVVLSSRVAELAAENTEGDDTASSVLATLTVTSPLESEVLVITSTRGSAESAAETANAMANAYLQFRAQNAQNIADRLVKNLQGRIDSLLEQLSDDAGEGASPTDLATIQQITNLRILQSQIADVAVDPGVVITVAEPSSDRAGPGLLLFIVPGLVLGVMAGLVAAIVHDRRDPKVHSGERLAERFTVRVVDEDETGDAAALAFRVAAMVGLLEPISSRPRVVGVLGADQRSAQYLGDLLADSVETAGLEVGSIEVGPAQRELIQSGWPSPKTVSRWGASCDVLVVTVPQSNAVATTVQVATRIDCVVVAADAESRLVAVADLVDRLDDLSVEPDAVVVLPETRASARQAAGAERFHPPITSPGDDASSEADAAVEDVTGSPVRADASSGERTTDASGSTVAPGRRR